MTTELKKALVCERCGHESTPAEPVVYQHIGGHGEHPFCVEWLKCKGRRQTFLECAIASAVEEYHQNPDEIDLLKITRWAIAMVREEDAKL